MLFVAGGHATYLHIDHIRKMIPNDIPLHGFADAGYVQTANNNVIIIAYTGISLMLLISMGIMYREDSLKPVSTLYWS